MTFGHCATWLCLDIVYLSYFHTDGCTFANTCNQVNKNFSLPSERNGIGSYQVLQHVEHNHLNITLSKYDKNIQKI